MSIAISYPPVIDRLNQESHPKKQKSRQGLHV